MELSIPGFGDIQIKNIILDFNGTLAKDGILIPKAIPLLKKLSKKFELHVVTGDSFGTAQQQLKAFPCHVTIIPAELQGLSKLRYLAHCDPEKTMAIGNGRNDVKVLQAARVGITVVGPEGAAAEAMNAADIVVSDITVALELLLNPKRLSATLRN